MPPQEVELRQEGSKSWTIIEGIGMSEENMSFFIFFYFFLFSTKMKIEKWDRILRMRAQKCMDGSFQKKMQGCCNGNRRGKT